MFERIIIFLLAF